MEVLATPIVRLGLFRMPHQNPTTTAWAGNIAPSSTPI